MGRKTGAWLGWILAALILYFFENNTGTRAVLLITLLVPLFSVGCAWMAARHMTVFLQAPDNARAGEKIRCTAAVHASGWKTGCSVCCVISGRNVMTGEHFEAGVSVSHDGTCAFETESSRCGQILLSVLRAEAQDWFGIAKFRRDACAAASVIVKPALYPVFIRTDPDSGSGSPEAGGSRRQAEDPEPGDLRLYVPGDPVRQIHWKLSEKTDQMLIRDSAPEALDLTALLLETVFPGEADPDAMHAAAQGLLSVSRALSEAGIGHAVITEKNGEIRRTDVTDDNSFHQAEEQVLTVESRSGGISIGTLFRQQAPDLRFRRVVLFSPHPACDVSGPAERQPVTLVLPPFVPYSGPESGIRTDVLDPADARLDI